MSDTPRTDAEYDNALEFEFDSEDRLQDMRRFSKKLERELNAANDRIKRLEEAYEGEIGEQPELLGSNVMGLLKRELNFAQKRIKRLEEGGDRAILNSYLPDRIAMWNKAKEDKL